jgi:hypothetical protein
MIRRLRSSWIDAFLQMAMMAPVLGNDSLAAARRVLGMLDA